MAAAKVPYIGSKISLVSNAEIRYEGTLYTINTTDSTIALQSVRCFGTEGRKFPEIPPSSEVYDYIIFRGQDIKDLTVLEACNATSDPAIVSINERPRGGKGCGAQGATGKGAAATGKGASAGATAALGSFGTWGQQSQGAARGAQDRSAGYGGGSGAGWGAGSGTGGKGGWSGGAGGAWGGAGLTGRSSTGWGATSGGGYKGGKDGGGAGKGGKSGLASGKGKADSGKAGYGGGKDKAGGKGKDRGCGGKDKGGGKASSKGGKGDFGKGAGGKGGKGGGGRDSGKGGKSGGRKSGGGGGGGDRGGGGGGGGGAGQTVGELPPEENAEVKREFAQEFDVSASNDKFDKVQTIDGTGFEDKLKPLEGYNKSTSFFDSISCEATERAAESDRPKVDRDKAREVDKETFGDTRRPPRPTSGRSGKGRRRGGGGGKGYRS